MVRVEKLEAAKQEGRMGSIVFARSGQVAITPAMQHGQGEIAEGSECLWSNANADGIGILAKAIAA
jgi:hypothetical protein